MRTLLTSLIVAAGLCVTMQASATPGTAYYSGKPDKGVPGDTCITKCHADNNPKPTLDITLPTTIKAGETGQVTLVINGTRKRTSMNAAFSDGVHATAGQNVALPAANDYPEELAAVDPPPNGAAGTYKFGFVAPNKNGPITLWIAAMSASGSGNGGDGVTVTTRSVTVTDAVAEPDAGTPSSSGNSSGSTPGPTSSSSSGDADSGSAGTDPSSSEGVSSLRRPGAGGAGGCHAGGGGPDGGALIAAALAASVLARSRRRKTPQ